MKRYISFFLCFVISSGLCCHALADQASAVDPEHKTGIYTEGRVSIQLVSGALFSLTGFPEGSPDLNYAQTNVRVGWMLADPGPGQSIIRGNWEGLVEVSNSIIFTGPGNYIGGLTGLLRYNFVQPDWDLIPYIQGGVGIVYNDVYKDDTQVAIGQAIEFTPQCSIGVHYLVDKNWAVAAEGMFHHISNAGMSRRNNSINSLGGFIGVTYFFDQIRVSGSIFRACPGFYRVNIESKEGAIEMFYSIELTIPLYQVGLLLLLSSVTFFLGKARLALLINYLFVFYWGYWLNKEAIFGPGITQINSFTLGVYGFSALIFILALIGFLHKPA